MAETLSPFVYWGQTSKTVSLKVHLREVSHPEVELDENHVRMQAVGAGSKGQNKYAFDLEFYLPVDAEKSNYRVTGQGLEFQIQKQGEGEIWPRLTVSQLKPPWLKVDFDRFAFEDDEESDEDEDEKQMAKEMAQKQMLDKLKQDMMNSQQKDFLKKMEQYQGYIQKVDKTINEVKMGWLFIYNMFQWIGFVYAFLFLSYKVYVYGQAAKSEAYDDMAGHMMVLHLVAMLEIVHVATGITKGSVMATVLQIFGRNFVLLALLSQEPLIQKKEPVWWLFMTWSAVELVRYPYYMMSVIKKELSVVTWLRYTIWIPLYPLGFLLEGLIMLMAYPYFERSQRFTVELPNSLNMSFHFPTFLKIYMLCFLPGMYINLKHMYAQRKKKIGPGISSVKGSKKKR